MTLNLLKSVPAGGMPGRPMIAAIAGHQIPDLPPVHAPEPASLPCTIILASGMEDGGTRATLALSLACTALSMESDTHVFLVGQGSYWAYQGPGREIQVQGFPAIGELLSDFLDLGGSMGVCAACDAARCSTSGDEGRLPRWPGVQVQGMATLMERMMSGRVVTF